MARQRSEPVWLTRLVVDAIHHDQLREHGGLTGTRDETALESALARPQQKWHYADDADIPLLAAAYAFGLARNHPYRDGNKRTAFLALVTFLELNGFDFDATDADVVAEFQMLAAGAESEEALAAWIREHRARQV
ncbi:MAG: type II toxin-antitoxin system death-on-curing family toxin [Acidobacteriota bacterium]|nr:type II toxin-antitoxin system death-on-curing family toxin [Acidobacteriota bacterium]